ncbi:hypothetical protein [Actinoplanes sp. NPDC049681]
MIPSTAGDTRDPAGFTRRGERAWLPARADLPRAVVALYVPVGFAAAYIG